MIGKAIKSLSLAAVCALLVSACGPTGMISLSRGANPYFEDAMDAQKHGRLSEAVENYSKYIEYNRNYPDILGPAYYNRANVYSSMKEYDKALADYSQAIHSGGKDLWIYYMERGVCYYDIRQPDLAIADFDQVLAQNPDYGPAYYFRAQCWKLKDDPEKALADLENAKKFKK
ncbi:MAG: tetratricopeptide repeat protein [Thermodesulfobacteriota bacterium]